MVKIEGIIVTGKFEKDVKKIRDKKIKERIDTGVKIICENPECGKPLEHALKGEKTVRIRPYRLIYQVEGTNIILLRFENRDNVYD